MTQVKAGISEPEVVLIGQKLTGGHIDRLTKKLKDLENIFENRAAYRDMDEETIVYEVASSFSTPLNTQGGLFYGITHIYPGKVGNEYFMTKGHFHSIRNRAEYYMTLEGEGMLLLMDENGVTRAEKMIPGSIHYIPGHTAHRTANVGHSILSFSAVWPADAGHDYDTISDHGFSKILIDHNGSAELIDNSHFINIKES